MSLPACASHRPPKAGFTLIEVLAAMVIFAVGVLMVIQLNSALSQQLLYSARTSEVVVLAHERLDSLESMPFDSLNVGTSVDTLTVEGIGYSRTSTVGVVTAVLYSLDVTLAPLSGSAPSYTASSFSAAPW